jgi:glycosyltransferase involved in cell wall biosynthesis
MLFTVITSCYNSTKTLRRTYASLLAQTDRDFEWILVDDCSNDDGATRQLIEQLAAEAPFSVKYYFLDQNYFASKSTVTACALAEGEYACILDHDDQLMPTVLETVRSYLEKYISHNDIAGVCGRCIDEKGALIGSQFKVNEQVAFEGEIRFRQRVTCELFQFTRVDILRPIFEKMKPGYTNGFAWAKISERYKYIFVNDIFRVYDTELPTSYSNSKLAPVCFPEAKAEALFETLEAYADYLVFNGSSLFRVGNGMRG